jgi:hypothetical protein
MKAPRKQSNGRYKAVVFKNKSEAQKAIDVWNKTARVKWTIFNYPVMYGGNGKAVIVRALPK